MFLCFVFFGVYCFEDWGNVGLGSENGLEVGIVVW